MDEVDGNGQTSHRIIGSSGHRTIGSASRRVIEPSDHRMIELSATGTVSDLGPVGNWPMYFFWIAN
jgi:hypothetical protein